MEDRMVQFNLEDLHGSSDGGLVLMRVSAMLCLFPEYRHIKTIENGWTLTVCERDWPKVEKAFRDYYLGHQIKPR